MVRSYTDTTTVYSNFPPPLRGHNFIKFLYIFQRFFMQRRANMNCIRLLSSFTEKEGDFIHGSAPRCSSSPLTVSVRDLSISAHADSDPSLAVWTYDCLTTPESCSVAVWWMKSALFLSLRGTPALTSHPSQQPQQRLRGQPEPQPPPAPLRPASDPQPRQSRGAGPLGPVQLSSPHSASREYRRQPRTPTLSLWSLGASGGVGALQGHLTFVLVRRSWVELLKQGDGHLKEHFLRPAYNVTMLHAVLLLFLCTF